MGEHQASDTLARASEEQYVLQCLVAVARQVISTCEAELRAFESERARSVSILDQFQRLLDETHRASIQMARRCARFVDSESHQLAESDEDGRQEWAALCEELAQIAADTRAEIAKASADGRNAQEFIQEAQRRAGNLMATITSSLTTTVGGAAYHVTRKALATAAAEPRNLVDTVYVVGTPVVTAAAVATVSYFALQLGVAWYSRSISERYEVLHDCLSAICDGYARVSDSWKAVLACLKTLHPDHGTGPLLPSRHVAESAGRLAEQLHGTAVLATALVQELQQKSTSMAKLEQRTILDQAFGISRQDVDLIAEQLALLSPTSTVCVPVRRDDSSLQGGIEFGYCAQLCAYATQLAHHTPDDQLDRIPGVKWQQLPTAAQPVPWVVAAQGTGAERVMYIAFGASTTLHDWLCNLNTTPSPVAQGSCWSSHSGLAQLATAIQPQLWLALPSLVHEEEPVRVILAGHSRGGAIAVLLYLMGALSFLDGPAKHVVTFGAPPVVHCSEILEVLLRMDDLELQNIYQFVHVHDAVPKVLCGSVAPQAVQRLFGLPNIPQIEAVLRGNLFAHVGQVMLIVADGDVRRWAATASSFQQLRTMLSLNALQLLLNLSQYHGIRCYQRALACW